MVVQRMPGETNGLVANGLSLPTMETFAYPVDAVSKGGREKAETYEPLWKIADRHRVLKVPEGRGKKKKKKKKKRKKEKEKLFAIWNKRYLPIPLLIPFSFHSRVFSNFAWLIRRLRIATNREFEFPFRTGKRRREV